MLVFPFGICFCGYVFLELENCGRFLTCLYLRLVVAGLAISARSRHFGVGVWFWFLVWNMVIIFFEICFAFFECVCCGILPWYFWIGFSVGNRALSHGDMASFLVFLFCHHPHNFLPFGFVPNVIDIFVCVGIAVWHVVLWDLCFLGGG